VSPFFTVILPVYNRAGLLNGAINSVIHQTFDDWELIIIDDGSTDGTAEVCADFSGADSRIRFHRISHRGHIRAKNYAVDLAKGGYITFLDSDDTYKPVHLQIYYEYLQDKSIDLLYGNPEIHGNEYVPDLYNPGKMIHIDDCTVGGTFAVKNKVLKNSGGFPIVDYGEDALLFAQLEKHNLNIVKTNVRTYIYNRTVQNSLTNQKSDNDKEKEKRNT